MNPESQYHPEKQDDKPDNAFSKHFSKMRSQSKDILEEPIAFPIMKRLMIIGIAFFIPIAGYIIYIVQLDDNPREAKYAGLFALFGLVGNLILLAFYIYFNNFFGNLS